jgi:hypothetical protein
MEDVDLTVMQAQQTALLDEMRAMRANTKELRIDFIRFIENQVEILGAATNASRRVDEAKEELKTTIKIEVSAL